MDDDLEPAAPGACSREARSRTFSPRPRPTRYPAPGLSGHVNRAATNSQTSSARSRIAPVARWRRAMADGLASDRAACAVGEARANLYRWEKRLEPRSRRPARLRKPVRPPGLVEAIEHRAIDFPMWGRAKLGPLVPAGLRRHRRAHHRPTRRPRRGSTVLTCAGVPTPGAGPPNAHKGGEAYFALAMNGRPTSIPAVRCAPDPALPGRPSKRQECAAKAVDAEAFRRSIEPIRAKTGIVLAGVERPR